MEIDSETSIGSRVSINNEPANRLSDDSSRFLDTSSSSESISEKLYTKQLTDRVNDLKRELQKRCRLNWFNETQSLENSPKVELNLFLHGTIKEQTLRQMTVSKDISYHHDEKQIVQVFQNDRCLLPRICEELVNNQRQQRIVYTEILFRPDAFHFGSSLSNRQLKDTIEDMIHCIQFFTLDKLDNNWLPTHIKLILCCNWNNVQGLNQFISLIRMYPNEIVGIDFYGDEEDCRRYWQSFRQHIHILRRLGIRYQASLNNYKDLHLIEDVIKSLYVERLCEAYEIVLSPRHAQDILIKYGISLVFCPISDEYIIALSNF